MKNLLFLTITKDKLLHNDFKLRLEEEVEASEKSFCYSKIKELRNKFIVLLLTFLITSSCKTTQFKTSLNNGLVIENAVIISPVNQTLSRESYIVIEGEEIVFIGTEKPNLSGAYKTVDAKGKYIIPGLIDSHVHVTSIDALTDKEEIENPEIVNAFRKQLPKSYLYFGYTTLIDLGTAKPKRLSQFSEAKTKPDLYYVGGGAVIGNGYGLTNWNDKTPNFIYKENEAYPIPKKYKKENHTPKAVVRRIAKSGAIAVKTYYEPGFDLTQPPFPIPTIEMMNELKKEAHKNNLVLIAHGNSLEAHRFLANAAVDIIAHGLWNWGKYRLDTSNDIPEEITTILDTEAKNNIGYMPTLQVINGLRTLANPEFLNDAELKNVLPKKLIDYYKVHSDTMFTAVFGDAPKNIILNNFNRISDQGKISLKYLNEHNGLILFGTDTPSSPTYGNPPGYNGYLEMQEMKNAGIPLSKILACATIENAKAFKLDKLYGTIEPGKKANILLLDKNPLEDIAAYNSISKIILKGKVINRNTLSAKEIEE